MVAHGLITGMLFFCVGSLYDRYHTREIAEIGGGVMQKLPYLGGVFAFVAIASLGLPGLAGFWGEVMANIHKSLGCVGTITNGSVRDIPMIPAGFQMLAGSIGPSHAYVHVADYGIDVTVHGMKVKSGDLIHADQHGAVIVPTDKIDEMGPALEKLSGLDPTLAEVVDLKFFCGFSLAEIAAMRGVSERTMQRRWEKARIYLRGELRDASPASRA